MIDRRINRENYGPEIDIKKGLSGLSDTEIIMEYSKALTSLYPHLIKLEAYCDDDFDDISRKLFVEIVYNTFLFKYGIPLTEKNCHKLGFYLHCFRYINHIECIPKAYPIKTDPDSGDMLTKKDLEGKTLNLVSIVPKDFHPTDEIEKSELPEEIIFDHVIISIASEDSGYKYKNEKFEDLLVDINELNFEFVAEDYNEEEHKYFKYIYHEDFIKKLTVN